MQIIDMNILLISITTCRPENLINLKKSGFYFNVDCAYKLWMQVKDDYATQCTPGTE